MKLGRKRKIPQAAPFWIKTARQYHIEYMEIPMVKGFWLKQGCTKEMKEDKTEEKEKNKQCFQFICMNNKGRTNWINHSTDCNAYQYPKLCIEVTFRFFQIFKFHVRGYLVYFEDFKRHWVGTIIKQQDFRFKMFSFNCHLAIDISILQFFNIFLPY